MEIEKFLSGYCRQLDASRMVEVIAEDGEVSEVDCCYGDCVYQGSCPSAKEKELSYRAALSVSKKSIKLDVIANQPAMNYGMIATGNHSHF